MTKQLTLDNLRDILSELADLPGETPVVISCDEEGNSYRYAVNAVDVGKFDGRDFVSETDYDAIEDAGGVDCVALVVLF